MNFEIKINTIKLCTIIIINFQAVISIFKVSTKSKLIFDSIGFNSKKL